MAETPPLPPWPELPLWDAALAARRRNGDDVECLWAALELLWPHLCAYAFRYAAGEVLADDDACSLILRAEADQLQPSTGG